MTQYHDLLIYIKGFLDSLAYLNTFDNDGKTYIVELLEKVNNDYQDTLRKRFNVKNWIIYTEKVNEDWRIVLKKELRPYFDQIIVEVFSKTNKKLLYDERGHYQTGALEIIEKIRTDRHFYIDHLLQEKFLDHIEKIVTKEPLLLRVEIDWQPKGKDYEGYYEGYCNDFLFDLGSNILFLHFGGSD